MCVPKRELGLVANEERASWDSVWSAATDTGVLDDSMTTLVCTTGVPCVEAADNPQGLDQMGANVFEG